MSVELTHQQEQTDRHPSELKDGQIGIVTSDNGYNGRIVQRYGDDLVNLGEKWGKSWTGVCESKPRQSTFTVRPLTNGTIITIRGNI